MPSNQHFQVVRPVGLLANRQRPTKQWFGFSILLDFEQNRGRKRVESLTKKPQVGVKKRRKRMTQLEQFRQAMYDNVVRSVDASMDLVDALSANTTARSVVELSLNSPFRRCYGSVYSAIQGFFQSDPYSSIPNQRRVYDKKLLEVLFLKQKTLLMKSW